MKPTRGFNIYSSSVIYGFTIYFMQQFCTTLLCFWGLLPNFWSRFVLRNSAKTHIPVSCPILKSRRMFQVTSANAWSAPGVTWSVVRQCGLRGITHMFTRDQPPQGPEDWGHWVRILSDHWNWELITYVTFIFYVTYVTVQHYSTIITWKAWKKRGFLSVIPLSLLSTSTISENIHLIYNPARVQEGFFVIWWYF